MTRYLAWRRFLPIFLITALFALNGPSYAESIPSAPEALTTFEIQTGVLRRFFMVNAKLGWKNKPSAKDRFEGPEYHYDFITNRFGMRDRERSLSNGGKKRIAFLGDSHTWGVGIQAEQRFTNLIESKTDTECLNFSVPGYGPIQYWLMLDDILKFHPKSVVLVFCYNNDWEDNVATRRYGGARPHFVLNKAGKLVLRNPPSPFFKRWIKAEPLQTPAFKNDWIYRDPQTLSEDEARMRNDAIRINELILEKIKTKLAKKGIKLLLVGATTRGEFSKGLRASNILRESCAKLQIPLIETLPVIKEEMLWKSDRHWQPEGHRRVASLILESEAFQNILKA